jgi:pilus assembly protein CpaE
MKISLISPSATSLERLGAMLARGNPSRMITLHEGGISKVRVLADQERPDIIIVEGLCHDAGDLMPIELLTAQYPNMFVIMLCTQLSSELLINAMRIGVREVLPSPVAQEALEAALARLESTAGRRNPVRRAPIIAFMPCKGGSGATFLAANMGHQLGEEGKKVLLIDLNLQFGEAVLTLHDCKATNDIAQVARNLSRLDASFLSASTVQITPNFSILDAPDDPAQALEVKPEHLDAILTLAMNQYDFIILDVGNNLDELTIKALDRANKIFLVMQTMLPYVRNAKRMMMMFRSLGYPPEKVEILVNRFGKSDEIGLDKLRAILGIDTLRTVPNSYKDVAKAINLGEPLSVVSKSSPVLRAICELTESLQRKDDAVRGGLFSRLLKHS